MSHTAKQPQAKKWPEDEGRFRELVLYISQKCANDPKFTTLKLNKLLFFSDFWAYGVQGEPITGFQYKKLQKGPAPARMKEIKKQMVEDELLALQPLAQQQWHKPVNLRTPNLSVFKPEQIALVDWMIDFFKDMDGEGTSTISHKLPCWMIPGLDEIIPYEMVFVSNEKPTIADEERGRAVAAEFGFLEHHA